MSRLARCVQWCATFLTARHVTGTRPFPDEICPTCGGTVITASDRIPPMQCHHCGDRWAGLYHTTHRGGPS